jgi:hypothetical protein
MRRATTHGSIDSADPVPISSAIAANPADLSTIDDRRYAEDLLPLGTGLVDHRTSFQKNRQKAVGRWVQRQELADKRPLPSC